MAAPTSTDHSSWPSTWAPYMMWAMHHPRRYGMAQERSEPFLDVARRRFGVGMAPGRFFGAPAHFRISVAGERRVLEDGLEAPGKALDEGWS